MRSKFKKIFGIFFVILYLVAIYLFGVFSGPRVVTQSKGFFVGIKDKIVLLFKKDESNSRFTNLIKSEVVVEESAIIDVVDRVSPAVVSVVVKTYDFDVFTGPLTSESGIGTGFIIDAKGLIITNSHVVDNPEGEYSVVLKDGSTYDVAKVHLDRTLDIALLEINAQDLPTVTLGDSDNLKVGQKAIAIGNALGRFQNTVTVGVVSGIGREVRASSGVGGTTTLYESVIQTDAALNPGNSGGPLLNSVGQVIGISVATTPGADNISFAIPVNTLKPLLETFFKEGRLVRPFLGVNYIMITKEISQLRRLPEGAYISRVYDDTPASKATLKRGDIILSINDIELSSDNSLGMVLSKLKIGDEVRMKVDRDSSILELKTVLAESPEE